jgi:hypothetical protein
MKTPSGSISIDTGFSVGVARSGCSGPGCKFASRPNRKKAREENGEAVLEG